MANPVPDFLLCSSCKKRLLRGQMIKGFCPIRLRTGGKAFPRGGESVERADNEVEGQEPDK